MRSLKTVCQLVLALTFAAQGASAWAQANTKKDVASLPRGTSAPGVAWGKPIQEADIAAWNIDIRTSDGKGLPAGQGTAVEGRAIYAEKCAACHGADAKGGPVYGTMVGGIGSFKTNTRVLTPGSMYPYAPILFDYIRRAMPMGNAQSLSPNEVYALSAHILHLNGLVAEDAVMDATSLPKVMMPNRDNFIVDDRPDTQAVRCLKNCPPL
ncbi:MAG: c-type cytochrome [Betaproteobacteria bacterium]|nr:c-type cytochrome [Betaproteobacteria bacterium]